MDWRSPGLCAHTHIYYYGMEEVSLVIKSERKRRYQQNEKSEDALLYATSSLSLFLEDRRQSLIFCSPNFLDCLPSNIKSITHTHTYTHIRTLLPLSCLSTHLLASCSLISNPYKCVIVVILFGCWNTKSNQRKCIFCLSCHYGD